MSNKFEDIMAYGVGTATASAAFYGLGSPDIILGGMYNVTPIPLYNTQVFEVAISQDELIFRAAGFNYLGHQLGRHTGIRIDCRIIGWYQDMILTLIEALYLYCKGKGMLYKDIKTTEVMNNFIKYNIIPVSVTNIGGEQIPSMLSTKGLTNKSFTTFNGQTANRFNYAGGKSNPMDQLTQKYSDTELRKVQENELTYEHRRTFILFSTSVVAYNMYLQTYVYRRSVQNGKNVLDVSLFLRRYDPDTTMCVSIVSNITRNRDIWWVNEVEPDPFLSGGHINNDPKNIKNREKLERVFINEKKSFIKLESLYTSPAGRVQKVNTHSKDYMFDTNNQGIIQKSSTVTKAYTPQTGIRKSKFEFIIRSMFVASAALRRVITDKKREFLHDRLLLSMGLLNGVLGMATERYGDASVKNSYNIRWLDKND